MILAWTLIVAGYYALAVLLWWVLFGIPLSIVDRILSMIAACSIATIPLLIGG